LFHRDYWYVGYLLAYFVLVAALPWIEHATRRTPTCCGAPVITVIASCGVSTGAHPAD